MLLSCRYKFLFVHIAKTGGTSIRAALRPYTWRDPYRIPQFVCSRLSALTRHQIGAKFPRHAKVVTAKEMLPGDLFAALFKFAFVRNPWDLQVSSYHHIRWERPHLLEGISDFETFLWWKLEGKRPYHYILDASVEPQWYSLIDLTGERIVDFVGRYENLHEDFTAIGDRLGLDAPPRLPHKRRSQARTDYRWYYTDAAAELVDRYFKLDIEGFGYTFD